MLSLIKVATLYNIARREVCHKCCINVKYARDSEMLDIAKESGAVEETEYKYK